MAGHLLLLILMCIFSEALPPPPKLTVNPSMITETDSVTLNCQTSVPVPGCYFRFVKGQPGHSFSCLKTLTGTELLTMANQSSPAEVKVTCFYLKISPSPDSYTSSIIIRTSLPPKLTVSPAVINDETDSVTLSCETPSVSVTRCYFTLSGGNVRDSSCLKTLTGTELLRMSNQRAPAVIEVLCYYMVKLGETNYPSPHSQTSSVAVHSLKPQMALQPHDDLVVFSCSLPGSANKDTTCNLYFGESRVPFRTITTWKTTMTITKQWFCQFFVTTGDLQHLHLVQDSDASCAYSLGSEPNLLSPRSDGYSLTAILERESHMTQRMLTFTTTTGLTATWPHDSTTSTSTKQTPGWPVASPSITDSFISTSSTSVKPASETDTSKTPMKPTESSVSSTGPEERETVLTTSTKMWIWKFVIVAAGCGVTVGVLLLLSAILWNKRRAASQEVKQQQTHYDTSEMYHLYATISEEPSASTMKDMLYSTVQEHCTV